MIFVFGRRVVDPPIFLGRYSRLYELKGTHVDTCDYYLTQNSFQCGG